jgi:hypothetical protein
MSFEQAKWLTLLGMLGTALLLRVLVDVVGGI